MAIWRIFRRSPLSEEKYPNRNPAWKQALLIIDFQGFTRKGSSASLSGGGFFNNLFLNDDQVTKKMAEKHAKETGGDLTKVKGGWRVGYKLKGKIEKQEDIVILAEIGFKDFYTDKYATTVKDLSKEWVDEHHSSLIELSQNMQDVGDATALAGYGAAVVGAPIAGVGAAPGLAPQSMATKSLTLL